MLGLDAKPSSQAALIDQAQIQQDFADCLRQGIPQGSPRDCSTSGRLNHAVTGPRRTHMRCFVAPLLKCQVPRFPDCPWFLDLTPVAVLVEYEKSPVTSCNFATGVEVNVTEPSLFAPTCPEDDTSVANLRANILVKWHSNLVRACSVSLIALTCALSTPSPGIAGQSSANSDGNDGRFVLSLRGDRLSIDAVDIPLGELLSAIGEEAGIRVLVKGNLAQSVSRTFFDLPLEKALKRLLADVRYIQVRGTIGDGSDGSRIAELRVFGGDHAGPIRIERQTTAPTRTATDNKADLRQEILLGLQDADRGTRLRAIRRLSEIEDEEANRILTWVLESDEDAAVRGYSVRALQGLGGDAAVAALERGLDDPEATIRAQVVRSLGRIQVERAVLTLGRVLQGHKDPEMRRLAVQALTLHDNEKVPALLEAAASDDDHRIRRFARRALASRN